MDFKLSWMPSFSTEVAIQKVIAKTLAIGEELLDSIIIIIICAVMFKVIKTLVNNLFKIHMGKIHMLDQRKADTVKSMTNSVLKYGVYAIATVSILSAFGVDKASLVTLLGAGSVAIGLGAQGLISDIVDGFFILFEDQFGVGDIVTIANFTGEVEEITLRTTKIRGFDGALYIIPNGSIGTVMNLCKGYMNAVIEVQVDYRQNAHWVLEVLQDEMEFAARNVEGILEVPEVLGISSIDQNTVTIRICTKCSIKENYRIEKELRLLIKQRFDAELITIPMPHSKIHVDKQEEEK